jgi:hypothetical protein
MQKLLTTFSLCFFSLIIQAQIPSYEWLKSLSGLNDDVARGVCLDSISNMYITGTFSGTTTIGGQTLTSNGASDIFIAKLNANGNLFWAKSFGSVSLDYAFDIDCEAGGNFFITGGFRQTMTLMPNTTITSTGGIDLFTAKFNTNSDCLWAKTGTGLASEYGNEIVVGDNINVCVIGNKIEQMIFGSDTLSHDDSTDLFMATYNSTGNLLWVKGIPGYGNSSARGGGIDIFENTIFVGSFNGSISIDTINFNSISQNLNDVFIAKYSVSGSIIWAKRYGDMGDDYARGVGTDSLGNIYLSGVFSNSVNFDGNTIFANGNTDIFLLKLTSSGNLVWIKQFGNSGIEEGCAIEVSPDGNVFIIGGFSQTITFGSSTFSSQGIRDVFVAKIDTSGNVIGAKTAGSSTDDVNYAIGLNNINEEVCTVGTFSGAFSDGITSLTVSGNIDSYISKISLSIPNGMHLNEQLETGFLINPIPASEIIYADCKKGFQIYSSTGQLVKQSNEATTHVNISNLPNGLYNPKTQNQMGRFIKTE